MCELSGKIYLFYAVIYVKYQYNKRRLATIISICVRIFSHTYLCKGTVTVGTMALLTWLQWSGGQSLRGSKEIKILLPFCG